MTGGVSAVGGQRLQALEGARDRAGPGPVGGEVQRDPSGMLGKLPGDVQDAITQPLGFAGLVFTVEGEGLCPDRDVVGGERELEPRGVRGERVERQVRAAGGLQCLDTILDLGVLAVEHLQRGDVWVVLVGDEALEAVTVGVREGQLRAPGCGRSRLQISLV